MKTKILVSLLLGNLFFSCSNAKHENKESVRLSDSYYGNQSIVEKTYDVSFDKIEVATSINAEIIKSNQEKIVISAPSDIMDKILVEVSGDMVKIKVKPNSKISTRNVKATIYAKDFSYLGASSSGNIVVKDKFMQDKLDIRVSSSGNIFGNLEANDLSIKVSSSGDFEGKIWAVNLDARASSSGDIKISGKTKNARLESSSSGDIKAKDLVVDNATLLSASSSGDIYIGVKEYAKAAAASSGEVTIYKKGNIQVDKSTSSGGKIVINDSNY